MWLMYPSNKWGEGNGTPLQDSCLKTPMDGGAWWAAAHRVAKSRTRLSDFTFPFPFRALEKEGNGNPLECSCLENPRDGGAWWAAAYEVAQSQTQLKRLSSSSNKGKLGTYGNSQCYLCNFSTNLKLFSNKNVIKCVHIENMS